MFGTRGRKIYMTSDGLEIESNILYFNILPTIFLRIINALNYRLLNNANFEVPYLLNTMYIIVWTKF